MKDQRLMASLDRISKYLPNTTLDPLSRVKIDDKGRLWVDEDTILIVLRGHLIIEHELVDMCNAFLQQPDALPDRLNFDTRLRLVRALLGDDEFPKVVSVRLFQKIFGVVRFSAVVWTRRGSRTLE